MTDKLIFEVGVKDDEINALKAKIDAIKKQLGKMPGEWGAVGKAIKSISFSKFKIAEMFKDADTSAKKLQLTLRLADRITSSLARNTFTMARNIKDATTSLLKWGSLTSLFSGLLGAGGLFGIDRMARGVSGAQAQARRSGVSIGESKAAGNVYGQLLGGEGGVNSLLDKIETAQHTNGMLNDKSFLNNLPRSEWEGKNSIEVMRKLLPYVQNLYGELGKTAKGSESYEMEARGLSEPFGGIGGLNQLKATNLSALSSQYDASKRTAAIGEGTATAWSDFTRKLDAAGDSIFATFVTALKPLIPSLMKLSDAFGGAVKTVMSSPVMKKWIDGAGDGLGAAAKWLTSKDFSDTIDGFLSGLDKLGGAIWDFATKVWKLTNLFGEDKNPIGMKDRAKIERMRVIDKNIAAQAEAMLSNKDPAKQKFYEDSYKDYIAAYTRKNGKDGAQRLVDSGLLGTFNLDKQLRAYLIDADKKQREAVMPYSMHQPTEKEVKVKVSAVPTAGADFNMNAVGAFA